MRDCEMVCWLEIVRSPLQEARQWQDPSAWGTTVSLQSSAGPTTTFLEAHRTTGLPSPIALFGYSSPPIIINMSLPSKKSVQVGFHKKWYRQTHFKKTLMSEPSKAFTIFLVGTDSTNSSPIPPRIANQSLSLNSLKSRSGLFCFTPCWHFRNEETSLVEDILGMDPLP